MTTEIAILYLFAIHWVGDFLLQTNKMATEKSNNVWWLLTHVTVYVLTFLFATVFIFDFFMVIVFIVWIFNTHFITDLFTSRWTSKLYKEKKFYGFPAFFSVIGLDQLLHAAQIILGYAMFLS